MKNYFIYPTSSVAKIAADSWQEIGPILKPPAYCTNVPVMILVHVDLLTYTCQLTITFNRSEFRVLVEQSIGRKKFKNKPNSFHRIN